MDKRGSIPMDCSQQIGENDLWFGRFHVYLMLGPERSYLAAYKQVKEKETGKKCNAKAVPQSWSKNYKKWQWEQRARVFDEDNRNDERMEYAERQKKFREQTLALAEKMRNKADDILNLPIARRVTQDGQTVIEPVNFNIADADRLIINGTRLGQQALGEVIPDETIRIQTEPVDDRPRFIKDYNWLKELGPDAPPPGTSLGEDEDA